MARNLIRLSGFVPDEEIPISFVGLRPGEKLAESLVSEDEIIEPSPVAKVLRVRNRGVEESTRIDPAVLRALERSALRGDSDAALQVLAAIVPRFKPGHERGPNAKAASVPFDARVAS
jgi:FlaA1/EpsC-like NDP-sugar epimerase